MFDNKIIFITGGTGTFGKSFTKYLLNNYNPKKIIIYSRDEFKQYNMSLDYPDEPRIRFFLGDIRDKERLIHAMYSVDYVVHAAALKQVVAAEYNPFEFIKTNIIGGQNIIEASIANKVSGVVALSTDKSANPSNLYGATKLCSDKLFIAGNAYSGGRGTKFCVVRYGNVIGSRGSVLPLFIHQKKTGRLTVTDKGMTRFWITIDEAVDFVIKAFDRQVGGEIFVPKIPSMNIVELAKSVAPDAQIVEIGIRPGEKLHECMITETDSSHTLEFEDHFRIMPEFYLRGDVDYKNVGGKPMIDIDYTSDKNKEWLTSEDVQEIIKKYMV